MGRAKLKEGKKGKDDEDVNLSEERRKENQKGREEKCG